MASKVGPRGQITIDKVIRDKLGIKPKDIAVQEAVEGGVLLHFIPAPHRRSLRGVLKPRPKRIIPAEQFDDVVEKAVAREVLARMKREK